MKSQFQPNLNENFFIRVVGFLSIMYYWGVSGHTGVTGAEKFINEFSKIFILVFSIFWPKRSMVSISWNQILVSNFARHTKMSCKRQLISIK
jgi:hypothetical protein